MFGTEKRHSGVAVPPLWCRSEAFNQNKAFSNFSAFLSTCCCFLSESSKAGKHADLASLCASLFWPVNVIKHFSQSITFYKANHLYINVVIEPVIYGFAGNQPVVG